MTLTDYNGPIRQLDHHRPWPRLAHPPADQPTQAKPQELIERYAQRMLIENGIADGIDFFHMDALSSAVAMKVNFDLQLTLMANSLYRLLGAELGQGYEKAKSRHIFQDFVDATAQVTIGERDVTVSFNKRAHNPFLLAAGFDKEEVRVPWWGRRRLVLQFG